MFFGEHAVLRGSRALALAVDKRLSVRLTPRADGRVLIRSALGTLETTVQDLAPRPPFTFLLAVAAEFAPATGFELEVEAGFSSTVGLGSSAAVTAAALGAFARWTGRPETPAALLRTGLALIRRVQGAGSGTDLAASLHGGVIVYQPATLEVRRLWGDDPARAFPGLSLVYSGAKEPTPSVIAKVDVWAAERPRIAREIFTLLGMVTEHAAVAVAAGDWGETGRLMGVHQGLQDALGLTNRALGEIITHLREINGMLGVKISGSGLGDCALGLGAEAAAVPGYETIPVAVSSQGLVIT